MKCKTFVNNILTYLFNNALPKNLQTPSPALYLCKRKSVSGVSLYGQQAKLIGRMKQLSDELRATSYDFIQKHEDVESLRQNIILRQKYKRTEDQCAAWADAQNGITIDSLFLPPFIYRYKDKGTRDDECENKGPVDACGTDENDVAKYNPKKDKEQGLGTGHGFNYNLSITIYHLQCTIYNAHMNPWGGFVHRKLYLANELKILSFCLQWHR